MPNKLAINTCQVTSYELFFCRQTILLQKRVIVQSKFQLTDPWVQQDSLKGQRVHSNHTPCSLWVLKKLKNLQLNLLGPTLTWRKKGRMVMMLTMISLSNQKLVSTSTRKLPKLIRRQKRLKLEQIQHLEGVFLRKETFLSPGNIFDIFLGGFFKTKSFQKKKKKLQELLFLKKNYFCFDFFFF